uniref:acyl-CoA dehydrogenase family protein n=1 Tax=Nocardia farcinica TaxID=37329 RepID=UPI002459050D
MRFALSPEQLDFAGSVRKLLDSGRAASAVRAWSAGDRAPGRALIGQLAEQGVLGLAIGERYDGAEAEPVDLVVAFVELGRAAAGPAPPQPPPPGTPPR